MLKIVLTPNDAVAHLKFVNKFQDFTRMFWWMCSCHNQYEKCVLILKHAQRMKFAEITEYEECENTRHIMQSSERVGGSFPSNWLTWSNESLFEHSNPDLQQFLLFHGLFFCNTTDFWTIANAKDRAVNIWFYTRKYRRAYSISCDDHETREVMMDSEPSWTEIFNRTSTTLFLCLVLKRP